MWLLPYAVATGTGALYTWGCGVDGQLGNGELESTNTPMQVDLLQRENVVYVAAGAEHTVCLTDAGEVFTFGASTYGQLGHGDNARCAVPMVVEKLLGDGMHATEAACGLYHTLVLLSTGEVASWGHGGYGQLGHGDRENQLAPKGVAALRGQKTGSIGAGAWHSVAITHAKDSIPPEPEPEPVAPEPVAREPVAPEPVEPEPAPVKQAVVRRPMASPQITFEGDVHEEEDEADDLFSSPRYAARGPSSAPSSSQSQVDVLNPSTWAQEVEADGAPSPPVRETKPAPPAVASPKSTNPFQDVLDAEESVNEPGVLSDELPVQAPGAFGGVSFTMDDDDAEDGNASGNPFG